MKIKLKDLIQDQYIKWLKKNCHSWKCIRCPFKNINCSATFAWYAHKDIYSDKFLNQEVEIKGENYNEKKRS